MAKFNNGFENIKVELIDCAGNDLARRVCCFGQGAEFYEGFNNISDYCPDNPKCEQIVDDIIKGDTFPKYAMSGHSVTFSIKGISRICLAQLTREGSSDTGTFFCSESSGTRPLTQEQIVPMNIYANADWMKQWTDINERMEKLYCEMLDAGIPFMDARYLMPHNQTINICYTASVGSFIASCKKRLDNSIADEINYVYRLMIDAICMMVYSEVTDKLSLKLWRWLIQKMKVTRYSKNATYRNDFTVYPAEEDLPLAHNDWRKSQWKMELERMYKEMPWLLFPEELDMIKRWHTVQEQGGKLHANYDETAAFTPETTVKKMYYYKEHKNETDI